MTLWQKWVIANPVFRYHFVGQMGLLVRRPVWQVLLVSFLFFAFYLWLLYQSLQHGLPILTLGLKCLVLWIVAPLMTHALFASEFEKATWDMLILTRLTASQIVMGKFLSRLAISLFIALLFLPPLWVGALKEQQYVTASSLFAWMVKTEFVIIGWTVLMITVTLWLSYWLKRSMVAAAVSFAGQVFVLFILPTLWGLFLTIFASPDFDPLTFEGGDEWLKYFWAVDPRYAVFLYNPAIATFGAYISHFEAPNFQPMLWGIWQGVVYSLLSGLVVAFLTRTVAKATRKPI